MWRIFFLACWVVIACVSVEGCTRVTYTVLQPVDIDQSYKMKQQMSKSEAAQVLTEYLQNFFHEPPNRTYNTPGQPCTTFSAGRGSQRTECNVPRDHIIFVSASDENGYVLNQWKPVFDTGGYTQSFGSSTRTTTPYHWEQSEYKTVKYADITRIKFTETIVSNGDHLERFDLYNSDQNTPAATFSSWYGPTRPFSRKDYMLSAILTLCPNVTVNEVFINVAESGDLHAVESYITKGADVNAKANDDVTALMMASQNDHKEVVELLLAKGADINAKDKNGTTALMMASQNDHKEVVDLLLAKGADVNAKDKNGVTALMMASQKGADVHARKNTDWNALRLKLDYDEIVQLLIKAGAN